MSNYIVICILWKRETTVSRIKFTFVTNFAGPTMHPGSAAQIPAFYMDTSHLFSTPHPRLAPPSLAQQQGFQPGLSQVGIYTCIVKANLLKIEFRSVNISPPLVANSSAADSYPHLCSAARSAATPTHTPGPAGTWHWAARLSATRSVQLFSAEL